MTNADFSVAISNQVPGRCSADGCRAADTHVVTLAYCLCDEQPDEHGHPGSESADRSDVIVCGRHGAAIAGAWESFESLRDARLVIS